MTNGMVRWPYGGAWTGRSSSSPTDPPRPRGPGDRLLEIFGADTARQCLEAGLLDELVVHIAPVLLGDGVRLYGGPGFRRVGLERTASEESERMTSLRFKVVR
jgi:dihydrofolate reductase